jgi:hypothetical protein
MHIKATEDRLYQLILQEVRRVADFADSNHKRHVEFAELNAVFTSIVRGWEADLDEITDTELLHTSELPRGCSLKLEYPDRSSCRLLCDDKVLHVHRDGHGWRIDIESSGLQLISNTWRLTEEVVAEQATTNGVVPLSQLRQEVFQVLSGV